MGLSSPPMPEASISLFDPLHTFGYGFLLGCVFLVLALWGHWKTKREFSRYRRHLSDKLELDSRNVQELNKERTRLAQENENLRVQVARLNEKPENKLQREVEILARAEKQMMINAPGFAPAWEMAKSAAMSSIESEERGLSLPQKIFRKLLGPSSSAGSSQQNANGADSSSSHETKGIESGATAA